MSTSRHPIARLLPIVMLVVSLATSSGCRSSAPPPPSGFRLALVMSGSVSDNGWNASAYKALLAVRKDLGLSDADSPFVENVSSSGDQEENLRAYASKGYNVVFGHGNEYEAPALKIENDFPKTLFVISSGSKLGAHTMPIVFRLEDGAYLEGVLAAGMSKTGKIGCVGAEQIPQLASIFSAFELGAKAVNPSIQVVKPIYTGNWEDPAKAKQAALALMDQGADVLIQDLDAGAQGVFQAVQERAKANKESGKPVYALGTNSDQNAAAPDVILASAPIYTDKTFVRIAQQAKSGTLKPNDTPLGMKEGIVDFVLNPTLVSKLPAYLKQRLDTVRQKIQAGTFTVPRETN